MGGLLPQGSQRLIDPQTVASSNPPAVSQPSPSIPAINPITLAAALFSREPEAAPPPDFPVSVRLATPANRTAASRQLRDPRPRVRYRSPTGYAAPLQQGADGRSAGNFGSQSQNGVAEAQELLTRLGMQPGPVDGVLTPATSQAILTYAGLAGIPSDGTVNNALLRHLRADTNALSTVGSPGYANAGPAQATAVADNRQYFAAMAAPAPAAPIAFVGEVQAALVNLGFNPGPIDGVMSANTARAIGEYQSGRGMVVDGLLTGPLLANLRAETMPSATKRMGPVHEMGNGQVSSYIEYGPDGAPISVGVVIERAALGGLPNQVADPRRCADLNGNGQLDQASECLAIAEMFLALPDPMGNEGAVPIQWVGLNWLPSGLSPSATGAAWPQAWAQPHLGIHFYLQDFDSVQSIGPGQCGALADCGLFARATAPISPELLPSGYVDVGGVISQMGNHLINAAAPEIAQGGGQRLTHSFVYGSFDGALTFFEPMVTPDYLATESGACFPISQPMAFAVQGYYPTAYCVRQRPEMNAVSVSLEGLIAQAGTRQFAAR